jgi:aldehyde:ferredoxin oxidoreductase
MDRADMEVAKDMFYAEMGWHKATGMPTKETLEKLNLGFAVQELSQRGLL